MKKIASILIVMIILCSLCVMAGAYDTGYTNKVEPKVARSMSAACVSEPATECLIFSKNADDNITVFGGVVRLMAVFTAYTCTFESNESKDEMTDEEAELLYAQFLIDEDDSAGREIAVRAAGSEAAFVSMMNNKADTIGMKHTEIKNIYGNFENTQKSTAFDLLLLLEEVMKRDRISAILSSDVFYTSDKSVAFSRNISLFNKETKLYNSGISFYIDSSVTNQGVITMSAANDSSGRLVTAVTCESNGTVTDYTANYLTDINIIYNTALKSYYVADLASVGKVVVENTEFELSNGSKAYVAMQSVQGQRSRVTLPVDYGVLVYTNPDKCTLEPVTKELPETVELNDILTRAYLKYNNDILLTVDLRVVKIVTPDGRQYSADYSLYSVRDGLEQAARQYKKNDWIIVCGLVVGIAAVAITVSEILKRKIV